MDGDNCSVNKLGFLVGIAVVSSISMLFYVSTTSAVGLKLAPLEYRTTLKKGEKQKGFIDVSNPSEKTVRVRTSVQALKQTDNQGSLVFFDNEQLSEGIKLDVDDVEIGPRQALRMYFLIDGSKLPQGDVYGAIFFTTYEKSTGTGTSQAQQVRLGSILSIVNATPGLRQAQITGLSTPLFQIGDTVKGTYTIKNTASSQLSTGFYPEVQTSISPIGEQKKQTASLVFAGRERVNDFSLRAPLIGFYRVSAEFQGKGAYKIIFVINQKLLVLLAVLGVAIGLLIYRYKKRHHWRRHNPVDSL